MDALLKEHTADDFVQEWPQSGERIVGREASQRLNEAYYFGIAELRDGKVVKMTEYFANPFEAPAWRAPFVERMDPATT